MGCGCGGAPRARRPVRNLLNTNQQGVLGAVANSGVAPAPLTPEQLEAQTLAEERKRIEKLRRDAILRALGRP